MKILATIYQVNQEYLIIDEKGQIQAAGQTKNACYTTANKHHLHLIKETSPKHSNFVKKFLDKLAQLNQKN